MVSILNTLKIFKGGAAVPHHKETAEFSTRKIAAPEMIILPLQQHIGATCEAIVKKKDIVAIGQVIAQSSAMISAPIHASISGKVKQIKPILLANGQTCDAIYIENDGENTLFTPEQPQKITNLTELLTASRNSGIVGIGGAGFPLHAKLTIPKEQQIDFLVINGAECEPFITSDFREMVEEPKQIIRGIKTVLKFLEIHQAIIGIEKNKPQALEELQAAIDLTGAKNISVMALPSRYPQGAEKMLIYATTGRKVPMGKLPSHAGCLVLNVSTISQFQHYLETSQPLTSKRLTIAGDNIKKQQNVLVPIGMKLADIIEDCGGMLEAEGKVILGGPMMGIAQYSLELPITKQNNALLAFKEKSAALPEEYPCIRCGRCGQACPLSLLPMQIERAVKLKDAPDLEKLQVANCMECGCCSFVCPSNRKLVQYMRQGKLVQREAVK
ncbi:electron transport complex subunit RsxC [Enterococcus sp. LJL90]